MSDVNEAKGNRALYVSMQVQELNTLVHEKPTTEDIEARAAVIKLMEANGHKFISTGEGKYADAWFSWNAPGEKPLTDIWRIPNTRTSTGGCHHMNPAPYLDDTENVIDAIVDPRRKTWRKAWSWFAGLHIAALIPLWSTGNWPAIWFCGCVVYYCLMARHREAQP